MCMGPEVTGDDLSSSSWGGRLWLVGAHSGMFSQTHNFLLMIIFVNWLLSPMSQKKRIKEIS